MTLVRHLAASGLAISLGCSGLAVPVASGATVVSHANRVKPIPPPLAALMPRSRPLLGPSLAGGVRSLLPPLDDAEGVRDRQVILAPFADVDHDGTREVLELDLDLREAHPTYGFEGILRINTLDGSSGGVLGNYELPFHSGVPEVVEARVGKRGVPGLFIFLTRFISTADAPTAESEVRAVTGSGRELWMHEWVSTSTSTPTRYVGATNIAIPTDLLDHRAGVTDVLLGVYDFAGPVVSMTPVIVSGADGSSRSLERVTVPSIETTPWPVGAPDLDIDGIDDVLTVDTSGRAMGVMATSSGSGERLWHNEGIPSGSGTIVAEVGNVVGNDTADFVLGDPLRLFDGAHGDVVWNHKGGSYPVSPGDVDGDGLADILSFDAFFAAERFGVDVSLVSSRGRRLAQSGYDAPRSDDGISWVITEEVGDVDGDEVPDAFLHLLHYGSEYRVEERLAIAAASTRPLKSGSDLFPLGRSVGGEATADLLRVEHARRSYHLTALDGAFGPALWEQRMEPPRTMTLGFRPWAAGGNGPQHDLALSFFSPRAGVGFLMDGGSGRVIWRRRLPP